MVKLFVFFCGVLFCVFDESLAALPFPLPRAAGIGHPQIRSDICGFAVEPCNLSSVVRRFDGSCTNPQMPGAAMAGDTYLNLLPAKYADGISEPVLTDGWRPMPTAREISLKLFTEGVMDSHHGNIIFLSFAQFMAHDMSLIQDPPDTDICCTSDYQYNSDMNVSCMPIHISKQDRMYMIEKIQCHNFSRAQTSADLGCGRDKGNQINSVSSSLDVSPVYGTSKIVNDILRAKSGGLMRTYIKDGAEYPPVDSPRRPDCNMAFITGDKRSDQNPSIIAMHILLLKEHNHIARKLVELNPHWNDDRLFDEARRILIAKYQHISYYEWLPMVIDIGALTALGIISNDPGYVDDFDPTVHPGSSNEYAHAAFVYLHSNIPEYYELRNKNMVVDGKIDWSSNLFCQENLLQKGMLKKLFRGMVMQPMAETDTQFAIASKHRYDRKKGNIFGGDLRAIDIQRGRDVGLRTYHEYRQFCGADKSSDFSDFLDVISKENLAKLQNLYTTLDAVEIMAAGTVESHMVGSVVGPTFECFLTNHFLRQRQGDFLWYEHSQAGFSREQLASIKKSTIARVLCNGAPGISSIQPNGFLPPHAIRNIVKPCSEIEEIDFSLWKENI